MAKAKGLATDDDVSKSMEEPKGCICNIVGNVRKI